MNTPMKTARLAGLLYVMNVVTGLFSLMYVPSKTMVHGDAAATADRILASESLFRAGIAVNVASHVVFLLLLLVLYKLLGGVNRMIAVAMVALAVACVPIDLLAVANQLDALALLHGEVYTHLLTPDQRHAAVWSLLDACNDKLIVAQIFWGLWLLPFGYLVFKSEFLPKCLGILLMLGCFSYLIGFFAHMLKPGYHVPDFVMMPAAFGEMGIAAWLLIFGARRGIVHREANL